MDVCVVTFRNDVGRIKPTLRLHDVLWVRDNTRDNIGFGAAANELAGMGQQKVIVFVNPDGDPQPGCFDLLEETFDDEQVVAVEPSQGTAWGGQLRPERLTWLSGACMAVRRSAFEEVGGFDERFFMYGEDVDLSFRLAHLGRLVHRYDAEFRHDHGRRSFKADFFQARSSAILHRRYRFGAGPLGQVRGIGSAVKSGQLRGAAARAAGLVASGLIIGTGGTSTQRVAIRQGDVLLGENGDL